MHHSLRAGRPASNDGVSGRHARGARLVLLAGSSVLALSLATGAAIAQGQTTNSAGSDTGVETVVVSASRISIAGYTAPTPVTSVGGATLEAKANLNLGASLRDLPSMGSTLSPEQGSNANASNEGAEGIASANLRNMGASRTLVLFDGQRAVSPIVTGGQDLSVIPVSLVQRVDVVTGGASASWGSDAVSGVVNVVINKHFTGLRATIQAGDRGWGQSQSYGGDLTYGFDALDGRAHFEIAGSYNQSPNAVFLGQVPWFTGTFLFQNPAWTTGSTSVPKYIPIANTGSCAVPGGAILDGPLAGTQFGPGGQPMRYKMPTHGWPSNACVGGSSDMSNSAWMSLMESTPLTQETVLAYGSYQLTPDITAGVMLNYARNYLESTSEAILNRHMTIKDDNAFLPAQTKAAMTAAGVNQFTLVTNFLDGLDLANPNWNDFANSISTPQSISTRQFYRQVFELDGVIGDNWTWNAAIQHSQERVHQVDIHDPLTQRYKDASDAVYVTAANAGTTGLTPGTIVCRTTLTDPTNGCVPFNILGTGVQSPEAVRWIADEEKDWMFENLEQVTMAASAQGTLPSLDFTGAGAPALAFGMDYRKESGRETVNYYATNVLFGAGNFQPFVGQYNVMEGFGEVTVPLIKDGFVQSLSVNASGRMTSYSLSGQVETWKLGFVSQVNDDVRLRATWSYDLRAPNLGELFSGFTESGSHPLPHGQTTNVSFMVRGGNPDLKPETSVTWEIGTVLTPHWIPGLTMSFDWYDIKLKGFISAPPVQLEANFCDQGQQEFCDKFFQVNGVWHIIDTDTNFGYMTRSGLDFQADYPMELLGGTLNWDLKGNYIDESIQSRFDLPPIESAGGGGVDAKLKFNLSANYVQGPWNLTVEGQFISSGKNNIYWGEDRGPCQVGATTGDEEGFCVSDAINTIPAVAYLNLRGSYRWNDNVAFFASIDNALDTPPPYFGSRNTHTNTDDDETNNYYRTLGRVLHIGVRYITD